MSIILGLRSKHDAAAALLIDGELVAAASEERFRRQKHYFGFPRRAIEFCLAQAGVAPHQVDIVARDAISPRRAIARLARQPMYAWTPRLYREVLGATITRYVRKGDDVRGSEEQQLAAMGFGPRRHGVEHHYGHAAYAYYATGWKDAVVMVLDGRGHYLAGATYLGGHGALTPIAEIQAEGGSLGLFYSAVTDALGFTVGDGDGKTMGLACYGDPTVAYDALRPYAPRVDGLQTILRKEWQLDTTVSEGRLLAHYRESAPLKLLIDQYGAENVAAAAQRILEETVTELVGNAVRATGQRALIGGGGIFLNVKTSKKLIDEGVVDTIAIPPGPGDEGLAAGYAYAAYAALYGGQTPLPLTSPYLGPGFDEPTIVAALGAHGDLAAERLDDIASATARLIADGAVIGWFQGRMEYGPRALGARSVLADPRDPAMRDRINAKLKQRDWFMPFAPSVLAEYCDAVFVNYRPSPYMNLAFAVKPPYDTQVPAVMHIDRTARPQAVSAATNPLYHATIDAFRRLTGVPLVLNTSFNRHGLPIVCTPDDAVNHLRWGCIDALVIGPFLARRTGPVVPYPGRRAIVDLSDEPRAVSALSRTTSP